MSVVFRDFCGMIELYVNKQLTLSLIIPAYNEEHYIRSCLDAVAAQTRMPDEVIIVDNNSTDNTARVAREYEFVRVVREKRQGRGHARSRGFDEASSDIIGRIDVDTVLAPNWCERVLDDFAAGGIDGLTGLGQVAILPRIQWPKSVLWTWMYTLWAAVFSGFDMMWGANMAITQRAWQKVRDDVCNDDRQVHEDQDISLCILARGMRIRRDNALLMHTDGQTFHYFPKLVYYTWLRVNTIRRHRMSGDYARIQRTYPWTYRLPLIIISPLLFVPFFVVSLLFWPVDVLIRNISRTIFRSTG